MSEQVKERMLATIEKIVGEKQPRKRYGRTSPKPVLPSRPANISITDEKLQVIGSILSWAPMKEPKLVAILFFAHELGWFEGFTDWASLPYFPYSADLAANIDKGIELGYIERKPRSLQTRKREPTLEHLKRLKRLTRASEKVLRLSALCVEYIRQGWVGQRLMTFVRWEHPVIGKLWRGRNHIHEVLRTLHKWGCKALRDQGHDPAVLFCNAINTKSWVFNASCRVLWKNAKAGGPSYEDQNLDFA